mmetsp:Transcript_111580/g.322511  ORF Transcript_111580/g.322511 Transcript_111580/m.322511 type:complete len:495 (+) Transcript_111580:52-1536(+)
MAPEPSHFVNPIANPARYKKSNRVTLDELCQASYQGDVAALEVMLRTGDEDAIFNGDVNMHFTDVTALHLAAIGGQAECVKLLLEARADPHVRQRVPEGKDAQSGETARDKAKRLGHETVSELLRAAEEAQPAGRYQSQGIGNNRKLYGDQKEAVVPAAPSVAPTPAPAAKPAPAPAPAPKDTPPVALLFPGQGSQYVKMLDGVKDLPEVKEMLKTAEVELGYDLLKLCLEGPEEKLSETRFSQPALFVAGLAGVAKLRKDRPEAADTPRCVGGLSLGEYTALVAAGVLGFEDGLRLVKLRGQAMQEAAQVGKQAMVSIVGLDFKVVEDLCKAAAKKEGGSAVCQVANFLFPKGVSCAGTETAVNELKDLADKKGALKTTILKTGGGFHTSLMQPAQDKLKAALEAALPSMKPPRCAIYMNVTGEPLPAGTDPKVIVDLLIKQLVNPVQFVAIVQRMMKDGVTECYECGPQKQIKAMIKRIDADAFKRTENVPV